MTNYSIDCHDEVILSNDMFFSVLGPGLSDGEIAGIVIGKLLIIHFNSFLKSY